MEAFPLQLEDLLPIDTEGLPETPLHRQTDPQNQQDRAVFEREATLIGAGTHRIKRITPHLAEVGNQDLGEGVVLSPDETEATILPSAPRGSLARGLILHKLLEEVLTGELQDDAASLVERATVLGRELANSPGGADFNPQEAAQSVRRGLALPEIQAVRDTLIPECWISNSITASGAEQVTVGIADAVTYGSDGQVSLVVDWKSDVRPTPMVKAGYRAQVASYLLATGAKTGLVVFLSTGHIESVSEIPEI
jgi:exodeoxyribonuclease-5